MRCIYVLFPRQILLWKTQYLQPPILVYNKKTKKQRGRPKKADVREDPKSKRNKAPTPVPIQFDEKDFFQDEDNKNLAISDKLSTMLAIINSWFK